MKSGASRSPRPSRARADRQGSRRDDRGQRARWPARLRGRERPLHLNHGHGSPSIPGLGSRGRVPTRRLPGHGRRCVIRAAGAAVSRPVVTGKVHEERLSRLLPPPQGGRPMSPAMATAISITTFRSKLPPRAGLGVRSSLLRDKYERDEAAMILRHLPADLPVIELGGSLGVISALIRSRLSPGTRHLIVEANPALIEICAGNAAGKADGLSEVVNAAVHYDGANRHARRGRGYPFQHDRGQAAPRH